MCGVRVEVWYDGRRALGVKGPEVHPLLYCARPPRATFSVHEKVKNPASGVEEVKVVRSGTAIRPEKACAADMCMRPKAWE